MSQVTPEVFESPIPEDLDLIPVTLVVPRDLRPKVTYEELLKLCAVNELMNFEWDPDGTLYMSPPAGGDKAIRNAELTGQIGIWSLEDRTGVAFDSSAGFLLADGRMRNPDTSWVRNERWYALPKHQRDDGFAPITPDFAVELRYYYDRKEELQAKMAIYIANGVRLAWLIDPIDRTVEIHRAGRDVEILADPKSVSGEDVLPGFVLDLDRILAD